jgi:hypothetical protein
MSRNFIKLTNQQGLCPVCGQRLHNYGAQDITSDYISIEWKCGCNASGVEYYKTIFDGHSGLMFKDGGKNNVIDTLSDFVEIDDEDIVEYNFMGEEE